MPAAPTDFTVAPSPGNGFDQYEMFRHGFNTERYGSFTNPRAFVTGLRDCGETDRRKMPTEAIFLDCPRGRRPRRLGQPQRLQERFQVLQRGGVDGWRRGAHCAMGNQATASIKHFSDAYPFRA